MTNNMQKIKQKRIKNRDLEDLSVRDDRWKPTRRGREREGVIRRRKEA